MFTKKLGICAALALCISSLVCAEDPADKLPDTTLFYGRIDTPELLTQAKTAVLYIDADSGNKIIRETQTFYDLVLKECEKDGKINPQVFDGLLKAKLYLAILKTDEPRKISKTIKTPKVNDTGEFSETEFEETVIEEFQNFLVCLMAQTTPEQASELATFITQKKNSENNQATAVDLPNGTFYQTTAKKGEPYSFGNIGNFFVICNAVPHELANALNSGSSKSLSSLPAYQSYAKGVMNFYCNPSLLFAELGNQLTKQAEEAQKAYADSDMSDQFAAASYMKTQMAPMIYQTFNNLLGLETMNAMGATCQYDTSDGIDTDALMGIHFTQEPTPAMKAMLSGGRSFKIPAGLYQPDSICVMGRMGLETVLQEIPKYLPAQLAMQYQAVIGQLQQAIGMTPDQIAALLGGDMYMFVDQSEVSLPVNPEGQTVPMPKVTVALGIANSEAFNMIYSMLMMGVASNQKNVVTDSIEGKPVYCFGAITPGQKPDGTLSYALCNTGDYLVLGSWQTIENVINGAGEPDASITAAIAANSDANMLFIIPKGYQQKNLEQSKNQYALAEKSIMQAIEYEIGKKAESEEILRAMQTWIHNCLEAAIPLQGKAISMLPDTQIITGKLSGNDYVIRCKQHVKK